LLSADSVPAIGLGFRSDNRLIVVSYWGIFEDPEKMKKGGLGVGGPGGLRGGERGGECRFFNADFDEETSMIGRVKAEACRSFLYTGTGNSYLTNQGRRIFDPDEGMNEGSATLKKMRPMIRIWRGAITRPSPGPPSSRMRCSQMRLGGVRHRGCHRTAERKIFCPDALAGGPKSPSRPANKSKPAQVRGLRGFTT